MGLQIFPRTDASGRPGALESSYKQQAFGGSLRGRKYIKKPEFCEDRVTVTREAASRR